jgi:imidazolonepropionase-like amidohydrolase
MRTVFAGAQVFDGTDGSIGRADVAVADGRIVDVGIDLDGDEAVDVSGLTLLPGLFDTHVHVMMGSVDVWGLMQRPFSYRFYDAIRNLDKTLRIGITTVRDAGGADQGVKMAIEDGTIRGPRVQISLAMLSQTGGHGDGWMPSGAESRLLGAYPGMPSAICDGVDDVTRKVREMVRAGAEVIKIATSGGVMSPRDSPSQPGFNMAEIEAIVAEAQAFGLEVMSHAQSYVGIKNAVRAGVRSIEHGIYLDDEAIQLMLDRGAYLVPTLVAPMGVIKAHAAGLGVPEVAVIKAREVVEAHRDSFSRAVEAGVKVAMGTDSGVTPHGENLDELQLMHEGGMSPEAVLLATTRIAAELMGYEQELGTIEPGKRADLVAVSGDPFRFDDLATRIERVYKDGVLVAEGAAEPVLA